MAKAKPIALRALVIEGRKSGKTLQELSLEHGINYGTVQRWCSRNAQLGEEGLKPLYSNCGKHWRDPKKDFIYRAVRCFKAWHPRWGAEKIRLELLKRRPGLELPSARTLQYWFLHNGQSSKRIKQPRADKEWGKAAHDVWQIDAKEEMQTLDKNKNCWLNIKDEYTGLVIEPSVFPPQEDLRGAPTDCSTSDDKGLPSCGYSDVHQDRQW